MEEIKTDDTVIKDDAFIFSLNKEEDIFICTVEPNIKADSAFRFETKGEYRDHALLAAVVKTKDRLTAELDTIETIYKTLKESFEKSIPDDNTPHNYMYDLNDIVYTFTVTYLLDKQDANLPIKCIWTLSDETTLLIYKDWWDNTKYEALLNSFDQINKTKYSIDTLRALIKGFSMAFADVCTMTDSYSIRNTSD